MKKYVVIAFVVVIAILFYVISSKQQLLKKTIAVNAPAPTLTITPTPFVFTTYTVPKIASKQVYKIVMIGDSMTAALGPHGGGLSDYMNSLYKKNAQDPQ